MKICPNCGSVLADNEPYCENCSFNPDYDLGGWGYGGYTSSNQTHVHRKPVKSSKKEEYDDGDLLGGCILLGTLIVCAIGILYMYNWDIAKLILSNIQPIVYLIIMVVIFAYVYNWFNNL